MERSHQNRVTVPGHKTPLFELQIQSPSFKMKIKELRTCSPKISSIRPCIDVDRRWWSKLSGRKTQQHRGTVLGLKHDLPELQNRSPPFRWKINESSTSPPNFRSIEPQTKRDQTFDEIWAVKRKTAFFSLASKTDGSLPFSLFLSLLLLSSGGYTLPTLRWLQKNARRRKKRFLFFFLLYIKA